MEFPGAMTDAIVRNASDLLGRVNLFLTWASADGVQPALDAATGTHVASGWRPREVNDATSNAAARSNHIFGNAIDLRDTSGRDLARWCLRNEDDMAEIGLWMEDPRWTPSWVHLQRVPPKSGRRVYIPSSSPPKCAALPEQESHP